MLVYQRVIMDNPIIFPPFPIIFPWIISPENHGKWWETIGKMDGIYDGKSTGSLILMFIDFQKKTRENQKIGTEIDKEIGSLRWVESKNL